MRVAYLRFPDRASATAALEKAFPNGDPGLDLIGEAWRTVDEVAEKREGWFANWIGEELPKNLEAYCVTPDPVSPFRVFAGWSPEEIAARETKE